MDSWKEEQAQNMQIGGNAKAKRFFRQYNIDSLPIKEKYNTKAAEIYKEMV